MKGGRSGVRRGKWGGWFDYGCPGGRRTGASRPPSRAPGCLQAVGFLTPENSRDPPKEQREVVFGERT